MGDDQNNTTPTQAPMPQSSQPVVVPERDQMMQQLLKQLSGQMKPRETLQQPTVNPKVKNFSGMQKMGVAMGNMLFPMLGSAVAQSIKVQKEAQINEAANEFQSLNNALERAYQMAGGDKQKAEELWQQMPEFQAMFDPNNPAAKKRLKSFAKVFSIDYMNPDKTQNTVHYKGFQKFMQLNKASKLMDHMRGQMQQGQQQGGQPQQSMGDKFAQQYPRQQVNPDPGKVEGLMRVLTSVDREKRLEGKEEVVRSDQGLFLKDAQGQVVPMMYNGKQLTGNGKVTGKPGGVVNANNVPYGVIGPDGHSVMTPKDPNWGPEQKRIFDAANDAYKRGEDAKTKRMEQMKNNYVYARMMAMEYPVFDRDTNAITFANAKDINDERGRYGPASIAAQMQVRESLFNEIDVAAKNMSASLDKLPDYVFSDAGMRARIAFILSDADKPSDAMRTFLQSTAAQNIPDSVADYLTSLASLSESAQSARTLGGLGQGSDLVRHAILKMVPGATTPTKAYARMQMGKFTQEMGQLKTSLMKVGLSKEERDKLKKDKAKPVTSVKDIPNA